METDPPSLPPYPPPTPPPTPHHPPSLPIISLSCKVKPALWSKNSAKQLAVKQALWTDWPSREKVDTWRRVDNRVVIKVHTAGVVCLDHFSQACRLSPLSATAFFLLLLRSLSLSGPALSTVGDVTDTATEAGLVVLVAGPKGLGLNMLG